jgi:hypothetical protein
VVVVVVAVVVVGTVVVVVTVVFVGDVWAIPLPGVSEMARTAPVANSAANAETFNQPVNCFLSMLTSFPSPEAA